MTGFSISAYTSINALGATNQEVLRALQDGRSGLRPAPFPTPMPVTCGFVDGDLEPLPPSLRAYDTRQARLACHTLDGIMGAVSRAIGRHGADRVGIVGVRGPTGGVLQ